MNTDLPGVVVTGASGFVGRHVLSALAGRYRLFCLARRSRREAGVPDLPDLRWTQVDLAVWDTVREVVNCVKDHGGASAVIHLAGYYDFHNMEHPEYERTNVGGTVNALKLASQLGVDRFIFASSLAACEFPEGDAVLTEDSPCDAAFAYARSKRRGEELVQEYADRFPVAIVRMAAMFSDWCEYPPLYVFLKTWLSDDWNARILGGRGDSAVPYLHVTDLVRLFEKVVTDSADLPRSVVLNASPNHCTSHRELYEAATHAFFADSVPPYCMPKGLAVLGVWARWWLGKLLRRQPFEAPWMLHYVDKQLRVDATRTHQLLDWRPTPRLDASRRLLSMIENMKTHRAVWHQRNLAALQRVASRPNLRISLVLEDVREDLVTHLADVVSDPANAGRFCNYADMERSVLEAFIRLLLQVVVTAVRTGDRQLLRHFAHVMAQRRRDEGFESTQVQYFLGMVGRIMAETLALDQRLDGLDQAIHDHVTLGFNLAVDAVEDVYDVLELPETGLPQDERLTLPGSAAELERLVRELEDVCE